MSLFGMGEHLESISLSNKFCQKIWQITLIVDFYEYSCQSSNFSLMKIIFDIVD